MKTKKLMEEYLKIVNDFVKIERENKNIKVGIFRGKEGLEELKLNLYNFWIKNLETISKELKEKDDLKTFYWGGTPTTGEKFVKRMSLYSDILVIEDPFIHNLSILDNTKYDMILDTFAIDICNINQFTDWITEGIVVLFPGVGHLNEQMNQKIMKLATEDLKYDEFKIEATHYKEEGLNQKDFLYVFSHPASPSTSESC